MDAVRLASVRQAFHQIPELGFEEHQTQALLLSLISELPQTHLQVTTWRTGVLALVRGSAPTRRIAYRADMDGLPIREETGVPFASTHDGMMHACGHDVHMTIGYGLLSHFATNQPVDDILFVFQPAEEGPGGALPMLASDEFQALRPDAIFALHVQPDLAVGQIGLRPGILFANTSELFIDLIGRGGHAAFPHRANDMVVAGAQFIGAIQSIVSRNIDPLDSAVITIGRLEAGTKQNIIAEQARIEGTIRALSNDTMGLVKQRIESVLDGIARMFDCTYALDYGANYYQVWNEERLTEGFISFIETRSLARVERVPTAMTGEDFGYFLRDIPGFLFWLGAETPYGLHHAKMLPNQACVEVALKVLIPYFTERGYLGAL
ncbi:N-acetyldiaminopimelate deacetylase [Alicyclobacillus acidoterrestris]|uniref:N-acetyldiaminopimelate deacetylase n=1 Tax=Alicyclobacillus acidoterrestris (strain ATCC 49025 / DSM 3922 / CIP 106132 / NCIMB 13137 / GD3B) TaxID=1356854 RepID=A0A9E6ZJ82_ALIAG|nr:N-acetyldiaminopimelate deacetylase [Alicyclobacillus acidoterrestris]UNO50732.1 N-acetyldiaminopimelate deacetylase [Alicyclobacillus acidoterrestris]